MKHMKNYQAKMLFTCLNARRKTSLAAHTRLHLFVEEGDEF